MEGRAEVMSHWPRDKDCPRNFDRCAHILRDRDGHSRNSTLLDLSLNQSHGLMANGSGRCEQRDVCPLFLIDGSGDVFSNGGFELLRIHVVADKAEEVSGKTTDDLFTR